MIAPIETERLILRATEPSDAKVFYALNSDPEVLRYTGDTPFPSVKAVAEFLEGYEQFKRYGLGRMAMVRKADCAILGWCGLHFDDENGETDIGYRLFRRHWRQGYATEAARAAVEDGIQRLGIPRVFAHVHPQNRASLRVTEKLGMTHHSTYEWEGEDWWKLELPEASASLVRGKYFSSKD